jgi:hypothetical protein
MLGSTNFKRSLKIMFVAMATTGSSMKLPVAGGTARDRSWPFSVGHGASFPVN